jgi:hypothetical protein
LSLCVSLAAADGAGPPLHIATASSDGVVKVWDSRALSSSSSSSSGLQELAQVSTNGRITGMVLSAPERKAAGAAAAVGAGGAAAAANGQQVQVGAAAASLTGPSCYGDNSAALFADQVLRGQPTAAWCALALVSA